MQVEITPSQAAAAMGKKGGSKRGPTKARSEQLRARWAGLSDRRRRAIGRKISAAKLAANERKASA